MRAFLLILMVVVVVVIIAIGSGFVDINQIRGARAPVVSATQNGITAKGGQAPAFDVETGSVKVGSKETTVRVPQVQIQPPQNQAAPVTNNAQ